jgi:hypothetical protein
MTNAASIRDSGTPHRFSRIKLPEYSRADPAKVIASSPPHEGIMSAL